MKLDKNLEKVVKEIADTISPVKIYLYGDIVKEDEDSDKYSLCVLLHDKDQRKEEDILKVEALFETSDRAQELIILDLSEFYERAKMACNSVWEVVTDGVVVHNCDHCK